MDGRSRRGRVGCLGGQREPLAPPGRGSRAGRGAGAPAQGAAGEAQLLQRAQSTPPAGQARGTLRALARELVVRGIASRIRYETVRRVLKKRTDALATGAAVLSAGVAGGGLREPDGSGAERL